ncbi:MAG: NifB/NifX family molybdenum-iron cluster-binding protein [Sphaerochaetaceae bacterium]
MKVAIPTANGMLTAHFGHCQAFTIFEVDCEKSKILNTSELIPPPHEPGVLPRVLGENGIDVVIAGGMGSRAQQLFAERGITVIPGAPSLPAREVLERYLANTLETGDNACDH